MEFKCPKCSSDNIQKLSIIASAGTSNINAQTSSTSVGVGMGGGIGIGLGAGGGIGIGSSTTSGTISGAVTSQLAQQLQAPLEPKLLRNDMNCGAKAVHATLGSVILVSWTYILLKHKIAEKILNSLNLTEVGALSIAFLVALSIWPLISYYFIAMRPTLNKLKASAKEEHEKKMVEYKRAYQQWEQTYHCFRCGEVFELN